MRPGASRHGEAGSSICFCRLIGHRFKVTRFHVAEDSTKELFLCLPPSILEALECADLIVCDGNANIELKSCRSILPPVEAPDSLYYLYLLHGAAHQT